MQRGPAAAGLMHSPDVGERSQVRVAQAASLYGRKK